MPITIPNVCRFTVVGTAGTYAHDNIVDINYVLETGADKSVVLEALAELVATRWQTDILPNLGNQVTITGVKFVDLNSADGPTGEGDTNPSLDTEGGIGGGQMPANTTFLIKKRISATRDVRPGRWYLSGVAEGTVDDTGNVNLSSAQATDLRDGAVTFVETIFSGGPIAIDGLESSVVVVGHPRQHNFSYITGMILDPRIATQRRRIGR